MQNYDIRYDDKYGQLAQIDVAAEGAGYEPWVNQTLTSVNDSVVRLAVIEGELVDWHSHEARRRVLSRARGKARARGGGAGAIRPWCAPGRDNPAWRSFTIRARTDARSC
jgi:hypothetical protein